MKYIIIWSGIFHIPNKNGYKDSGYLQQIWTSNDCPIDYMNCKVGDRVEIRYPNDYRKRNFICRILSKYINEYGVLDIKVEVMNIRED